MPDTDQRIEELEHQVQALERKLRIVESVHAVFLVQAIKHQFPKPEDREAYRQAVRNQNADVPFLYTAETREVLDRILDQI